MSDFLMGLTWNNPLIDNPFNLSSQGEQEGGSMIPPSLLVTTGGYFLLTTQGTLLLAGE